MHCPFCDSKRITSRFDGNKEFYKAEFIEIDENTLEQAVSGSPFTIQSFMCERCKRRFYVELKQDLMVKKLKLELEK